MNESIRILIIEPGRHPYIKDVPFELEILQKTVGGHLQAVFPFNDPVAAVCDEEGLFKDGSEWNRNIDGHTNIKGTFFLCGLGKEDFDSLPDELADKYMEQFWMPEQFIPTAGTIRILRIDDGTRPPKHGDWITVTCYGKKEVWSDRKMAQEFYMECVLGSDGSEKERYANILTGLLCGRKECSDGAE